MKYTVKLTRAQILHLVEACVSEIECNVPGGTGYYDKWTIDHALDAWRKERKEIIERAQAGKPRDDDEWKKWTLDKDARLLRMLRDALPRRRPASRIRRKEVRHA